MTKRVAPSQGILSRVALPTTGPIKVLGPPQLSDVVSHDTSRHNKGRAKRWIIEALITVDVREVLQGLGCAQTCLFVTEKIGKVGRIPSNIKNNFEFCLS